MLHRKNPWYGCDRPWQEFKWDMRHPGELFRVAWLGVCGRNPELAPELRMLGSALIVVGFLQVVLGIVIVVTQ